MRRVSVAMVAVLFLVAATLAGCTENQRARQFGGTARVELPPGQKLVVATWKGDDLWYLTRPMRPGEQPEVYEFVESSSFGIVQGKVVLTERK